MKDFIPGPEVYKNYFPTSFCHSYYNDDVFFLGGSGKIAKIDFMGQWVAYSKSW